MYLQHIRHITLKTLLLLLSALPTATVCDAQTSVKVQHTAGIADSIPDLGLCFDILTRNRTDYNQYNDSIFQIKEHTAWVRFFKQRAIKNQRIFLANKEAIGIIENYFAQPCEKIQHEAYVRLWNGFDKYMTDGKGDPFICLKIGNILDRHYQQDNCPNKANHSRTLNVWMGTCCYRISLLGNDSAYVRKAYLYFMRNMNNEAATSPSDKQAMVYTLFNLIQTQYIRHHLMTTKQYIDYTNRLKALIEDKEIRENWPNDYRKISVYLAHVKDGFIRNVYLADTTMMEKHMADSLMADIVDRNTRIANLSDLSYVRTMLLMAKLGRISYKEALENSLSRHNERWKQIRRKRLAPKEFTDYLQPFSNLFYINDMAEIPFERKRKVVKTMCKNIETVFQNREDRQSWTNYVSMLNTLTTYSRLIKYLKPSERVRFLNTLNVATQVTTYAHSVHVSMIAKVLMEGILKYEPELLAGTMNYRHVADIERDRKMFVHYIEEAAMYHDLGKNSIISVVNNDYRPITDEEFAIIKRHPELGLQYLELSPALKKYHDTTLGHHKWYNGKGGYPDSFDNTKSDVRTLIDIVTLSDCLQAATEQVGRNYKGDKTFDSVMQEFRREAGTRYNPDIVAFIDRHPNVAKKMAKLVNEGWVEIYYKIYTQYIRSTPPV